jgi:hypothetical protein
MVEVEMLDRLVMSPELEMVAELITPELLIVVELSVAVLMLEVLDMMEVKSVWTLLMLYCWRFTLDTAGYSLQFCAESTMVVPRKDCDPVRKLKVAVRPPDLYRAYK